MKKNILIVLLVYLKCLSLSAQDYNALIQNKSISYTMDITSRCFQFCCFLASEHAKNITGAAIDVAAGFNAKYTA